MQIYNNVSELTGNTPIVRLPHLVKKGGEILAKLEYFNPTSSIKDRIAVNMINVAEKEGKISSGSVIVEPTSGNTGLGLAMVAAVKGYKLIITMPESMSVERRAVLKHLGAEIHLTPAERGMTGAVEEAKKIVSETPGAFMPQQFANKSNPEIHYRSTGPEIWDATEGEFDIFIAGVGTGGTLSGIGNYLKEKNNKIKIIAVEPENSSVLSGGAPGVHCIQGIGAGFIPEVFDKDIVDEIIKVSDSNAIDTAGRLAREEGIFCGISAGANVYAALKMLSFKRYANSKIVTIIPDTGERYLSTSLFKSSTN
jgi:cysteine synthase A